MICKGLWFVFFPDFRCDFGHNSASSFPGEVSLSLIPLLECKDIAFERDDIPLFSGVGFRVFPGQAVQVVGANGVGKTTLLRILATSLGATRGEMLWRGKSVFRQLREYRGDMLYIGHTSALKSTLSPAENLRWFFQLFPHNGIDAGQALKRVGLEGFEDVPCSTLSAGQLRRVALARLCASRSQLWILDEPLTSIDVGGIAIMQELMSQHLATGSAILMTSHQPLELENLYTVELGNYVHA